MSLQVEVFKMSLTSQGAVSIIIRKTNKLKYKIMKKNRQKSIHGHSLARDNSTKILYHVQRLIQVLFSQFS